MKWYSKYIIGCLLLSGLMYSATAFCIASDSLQIPIAFPGAEGFGKFASGGRGGIILRVTNLEDNGPGSFREAAEAKYPRTIVFTTSGTIHLKTKLAIRGNVTIAGQSAPGDGIAFADQSVSIAGDNVIIRYIRFRMGDRFQQPVMLDGNGSDDALGGNKRKHIIVDHCSISWSTDECFSIYSGDSTTLQWNLISEPLNYSYHFEKGDADFEKHGYGAIWGGAHFTAHHNLFAHCKSRTPRWDGIRNSPVELADFRNNVIYNWGNNNVYGGEGGNYNIVGNYYKYGPETEKTVRYQLANPGNNAKIGYGKWFVARNYIEGSDWVTRDNWNGIHFSKDDNQNKPDIIVEEPFSVVAIQEETAQHAFQRVLTFVGASFQRDTLDARIIQDVVKRKGNFIDVPGGFPHGTPYNISQFAWPLLQSKPAPADTDEDGIPDNWELIKGLNPKNTSDAILATLHPFYTNIEMYLNSIVE
ncbi:MAG: pectate lyase [Chitinophagia bacterium]|jgi:pectate lyase